MLLQGHIKYTDAILNNSKGEQCLTRLHMCTYEKFQCIFAALPPPPQAIFL